MSDGLWATLVRVAHVAAAVAITLAFSYFLELDDAPGDTALALQALASDHDGPSRVKVVRIDDGGYDTLFGERSPMDPSIVGNLIRAIAAGGPAVIGVDIESEDSAYASFPDSVAGVPVVWGRVALCARNGNDAAACQPQPAAGRPDPGPDRAGLAMLSVENDGVVRRYTRGMQTARGTLPTFTTAVLRAAGRPVEAESGEAFRLIRYRRLAAADSVFTADWVLRAARERGFARNGVFRGQIVLLGGTFWKGGDRHGTPIGDLAGVEVQAQILETELDGGGPRPPHPLKFFFIQFAAGLCIVAIFRLQLALHWEFLLSLALCLVAAPLSSLILFGTWKLWFYFLPAIVVWLIQQLYDEAKGYRDKLLLGTPPVPALTLPDEPTAPAASGAPAASFPAGTQTGEPSPHGSRAPAAGARNRKRGRNRKRRTNRGSPSRA